MQMISEYKADIEKLANTKAKLASSKGAGDSRPWMNKKGEEK